jgi:adhesin transport system outer membrane protein
VPQDADKGEKMKLKTTVLATLMGGICMSANAKPLQGELEHLVSSHPLLKASSLAIDSSEKRFASVKASLMPRITISASKGNEVITTQSYLPDDNNILGNAGTGLEQYSDLNGSKVSFGMESSIYAGGKDVARVVSAAIDQDISSMNLSATTQDVLLEGITAYLQVARYKMLIELTKENEKSTQRQLELERKRVAAGGGVEVDAMQAKTRLQIVRERRVYYNQGLRDVMANYEQVFGHAPSFESFQALGMFDSALPFSLDEAMSYGMANSPRIKSAELLVDKADQQVAITKSSLLPKIDLVMNKSKDLNKNALAHRDDFYVGLRMNWSFNIGREDLYSLDASKIARSEQFEKSINARNKNKEAVRIAWNQLINGRERLDLLADAANISKTVMEDRKKLRDAGKETALSVLDAEVEYYGVLANKINAMFDTRIGSYRLLATMGKLTPALIGLDGGKFRLPVKPLQQELDSL